MGVSAAIAVGVGLLGGAAISSAMAPKPPGAPPAAPKASTSRDMQEADVAAIKARRKATQGMGRGDTILTGPQGLLGKIGGEGGPTGTSPGAKTLLGS